MIFEFPAVDRFIQVTADYSNAVLVALLPYVSDYAHRLNLPVPQPVTAADVVHSSILPWVAEGGGIGGAGIGVKGGYGFTFQFGFIEHFGGPHSYEGFPNKNPDNIHRFFGEVKMSKVEAVQMARDTLRKVGIPLEWVFAEQEPDVKLPVIDGHTVHYYRIRWSDIWPGHDSVDMEIDAQAKRVERLDIMNLNLHQLSPKAAVVPALQTPPTWQINPEYAHRLTPILLRALDDFGQRLSLPLPQPLDTNQVERLVLLNNGDWPSGWLKLNNGWWFQYRNSTFNSFYAPDSTISSPALHTRVLVKEALGQWRLTQTQAIEVVARTLAKLNYPSNIVRMDFEPLVTKPAIPGIARYMFQWYYTPPSRHSETEGDVHYDLQWKVIAEVDADKGQVKTFYYDMPSTYWGRPPPVGVPISLPVERSTNQAPAVSSSKPPLRKPPTRPQSAFTAPLTK